MREDVDRAVDFTIAEHARRVGQEHEGRRVAIMFAALAAGTMLARSLTHTLSGGRQAARDAAAKRVRGELAAAGLDVAPAVARQGIDLDIAHATSAAQSLAAAWQAQAIAAMDKPANQASPYREIDKTRLTIRSRLERTAQHEVFSAYNAEHAEAVRRAAERDPEVARAFDEGRIVRIWDAVMDRRTCEFCEMRDGKPIEAGDDDPPLHVGCRCIATIDYVPAAARAA